MSYSRFMSKLAALVGSDGKVPAAGLASNAALTNLGYTPVNKAGDTMSGPLGVGVFTHGGNSGEARLGRADDRAVGVATLQLGGTSAQKFEIVDKGWSNVLLAMTDGGVLSTPLQPGFSAYRSTTNGDITYAAGESVSASMNTWRFNTGSCYSGSTGKFTAPVAGRYLFSWHLYNNSGVGGSMRIGLTTSMGGNPLSNGQTVSGQYFTGCGVVYLNQGDTAWLTNVYAGAVVYHESSHAVFTGCLLS